MTWLRYLSDGLFIFAACVVVERFTRALRREVRRSVN